jgi:hypothetical protein
VNAHITETTVPMEHVCCWECGIQFAVPMLWFGNKCKGQESVTCPNGHENYYAKEPDPEVQDSCTRGLREKRETQELRRKLMKSIHDQDQAEARKLDGKPPAEPVIDDAPESKPVMACPHCGKGYKYRRSMEDHVRREHKR